MPMDTFLTLPIHTRAFYIASAIVRAEQQKAARERAEAEAEKRRGQNSRDKRRVKPMNQPPAGRQLSLRDLQEGNWANVVHANN